MGYIIAGIIMYGIGCIWNGLVIFLENEQLPEKCPGVICTLQC